VMIAQFNRKLY